MNTASTDIDIDFADRDDALVNLQHVAASIHRGDDRMRHVSGVYFQNAPTDPLTGCCSFPHEEAPEHGYFKIDFLNQSVYAQVRDEEHLIDLLNRDPMWELLEERNMVEKLPHIHNHYGVVQQIKPQSIEDLAVVIALVRPGKRYLLGRPREEIDAEIWAPSSDGFTFKKAHAIAYAAMIVVQFNLIADKMLDDIEAEEAEMADQTGADEFFE